MDTSLYYNPNKMLSHNRLMNFVIGARGIGKSYAFKKFPINRFLKNGEQFIYVRRYKPELKKVKNYFDDVYDEFPEADLEVKGREFIINDQVAGWAIPLSTWQSEKSTAYPNVTTIIFDEFIRQKDMSHYLPNEVEAFLNLIDTVFRNRDNVRVICLSNAVTVVNPYFLYFKVTPDINKRFNAYKHLLIEIPESKDFSEERRKTRFGQLINETNYGDMSLDNDFTDDQPTFIQRRTKDSKFKFTIVYKGMHFGLWLDVDTGLMYMSNDHDPDTRYKYSLSMDDLNETNIFMKQYKQNYHLKNMVDFFKVGCLRFDNQIIRNTAYDLFNDMGVQ